MSENASFPEDLKLILVFTTQEIMKKYKYLPLLAIGSAIAFGFTYKSFQNPDDKKHHEFVQNMVFSALDARHYNPHKIDDDFSKKAFKEYIDDIDYGKQFLLASDVDDLKKFEYQIDDLIKAEKIDFYIEAQDLIEKRVLEVQKIYRELLKKPFKYNKKESYETDRDKRTFSENNKELRDRWRKYLKFSTVSKLYNKEKSNAKKDKEDQLSWDELEQKSREAVLKNMDSWFNRLSKLKDEDKFESYMNSFLQVFDPHTVYLAPKTNEDFNISMSGKLEGIGAQLQQKDGEIKVTMIVPGSPCALQGDLEVEDIILKAAEENAEPTDLEDLLLNEAIRFIRGKKGTQVTLTVRKIDGSIQEIPIIRDVVVNRETYAKSAIINDGQKVGYIKLPRFYADFNDRNGRRCSTDMKKEILKLKEEGMESLVIDLRNNGGGSLQDVVDIAGFFIDKGPVVQVKGYDEKSRVLNDRDPNVIYDGPLVIMINNFSASASEILAAALQDYDRALIVGSEQSFGKGTVQKIINFDRQLRSENMNIKPLGSIKLTTDKFYRINGGTTQLKGVESDIVFPDNYSYIDLGERERDYALAWDQIEKANYKVSKSDLNIQKELKGFEKRRQGDPVYDYIDNRAKELKENRDETIIPISFEEYKAELEKDNEDKDKLKDLIKENRSLLHVSNLESDLLDIESDSTLIEINTKWIKNLEKDVYLNEVVKILN